jgi:hypothetical protein
MRSLSKVALFFFCVGIFFFLSSFVFVNGATALDYQLSGQEKIGEGTDLYYYTLYLQGKALPVRKLEVDLANPYVEIQAMHPRGGFNNRQTVRAMAMEQSAVAAVNADFFHLTLPAAPLSLHMERKEILSSPNYDLSWLEFGIDLNRVAHISKWLFRSELLCAGERLQLYGYNQTYRNEHGVFLYDRHWGTEVSSVFFTKPVLKVSVKDGIVFQVEHDAAAAAIPQDGFVLIAEGEGADFLLQHAAVGAGVTYELGLEPPLSLETAIGGHVVLVNEGQPVGKLPALGGRASRTAVGISADAKKVFFVTIDGTSDLAGVTMEELALLMSRLGAVRALNLDGGGSTTMVARKLGEFQPELINRPCSHVERALPNAIGIFNRAPRAAVDRLFLRGTEGLLAGAEAGYRVTGHDLHYHPLQILPEKLAWEVSDPEKAGVQNGILKGKKEGEVTLRVLYQGVAEEKKIQIYGGKDIVNLAIAPAEIRLLPGQSVPLKVKAELFNGLSLDAPPEMINWQAELGYVENGTYYAGQGEGFGTLTAEFDGCCREIPVRIGGKREPFFTFREWQTTAFYSYPAGLPGSFEVQSDPKYVYEGERSGRLQYDFGLPAGDDVMIAYGQLGSGRISMDLNNVGLSAYVYGDASGYWLRAKVLDAGGKEHYVDLAKAIDWEGWRRVQGAIEPSWPQPLILNSIYLVQEPGKRTASYPQKGTIYIDNVEMIKGLEAGDEHHKKSTLEMWINSTTYKINGKTAAMDVAPFIQSSRTFIPIRFLGEAFSAEADWTTHPETGLTEKVTLENEDVLIMLKIGSREMRILDKRVGTEEIFTLDVVPQIISGRTYLPFRAIGEKGFGAEVGFSSDPETGLVKSVWFIL